MEFTIVVTPKGIFLFVLAILAIILIVYIILLIRRALQTLSKVNGVLDDTKEITGVASKWTKSVDNTIGDIIEAIKVFTDGVKGNQSIFKTASSLVSTVTSVIGIVRNSDKKNESEKGGKNAPKDKKDDAEKDSKKKK